jgi:hypothetical protein
MPGWASSNRCSGPLAFLQSNRNWSTLSRLFKQLEHLPDLWFLVFKRMGFSPSVSGNPAEIMLLAGPIDTDK